MSLKSSGKSREDLWALATITAVEFGIETNNMVCDGTHNGNPDPQCHQGKDTNVCHVNLQRGLQFNTGRRDCVDFGDQPYKATKSEHHPNAVGNGKMTADYFQNVFGFTGRETVAILGAHTIGRLNARVSLFRYMWDSKGSYLFNNQYYKY